MTNKKKALSFELVRDEIPVTIDGEDYVLVELDGRGRDKYLNGMGARMRTNKEGKPAGVKNFDGLQGTLIANSLFKIEEGERVPVTIATIQKWPAKVVAGLFEAAREVSSLDPEEAELVIKKGCVVEHDEHGECVVLRILDGTATIIDADDATHDVPEETLIQPKGNA